MGHYIYTAAYDGSAYSGWQKGGAGKEQCPSIQEVLESAFQSILCNSVRIHGSGRTDAGVHALGQTFDLVLPGSGAISPEILNQQFSPTLRVLTVRKAPPGFHSRYSAAAKTYCYRFDELSKECPFTRGYVYSAGEALDLERMRQAAELLTGEQDFRAFCKDRRDGRSTRRIIYEIRLERAENSWSREVRLYVRGNGFLYHMVRIIAGTLLEIGLGIRTRESIRTALRLGERTLAGPTLPPCGLWLMSVEYPGILESGCRYFERMEEKMPG